MANAVRVYATEVLPMVWVYRWHCSEHGIGAPGVTWERAMEQAEEHLDDMGHVIPALLALAERVLSPSTRALLGDVLEEPPC